MKQLFVMIKPSEEWCIPITGLAEVMCILAKANIEKISMLIGDLYVNNMTTQKDSYVIENFYTPGNKVVIRKIEEKDFYPEKEGGVYIIKCVDMEKFIQKIVAFDNKHFLALIYSDEIVKETDHDQKPQPDRKPQCAAPTKAKEKRPSLLDPQLKKPHRFIRRRKGETLNSGKIALITSIGLIIVGILLASFFFRMDNYLTASMILGAGLLLVVSGLMIAVIKRDKISSFFLNRMIKKIITENDQEKEEETDDGFDF